LLVVLTLLAALLHHRKTRSAFLQSLVSRLPSGVRLMTADQVPLALCLCVQTKPFLWLGLNPIAIFCLMVRPTLRQSCLV
jgi:hypothetical protein